MWIARDNNGRLALHMSKPSLHDGGAYILYWEADDYMNNRGFLNPDYSSSKYSFVELDENLFPEVTFENSPKELVIK